jgi:hypothetical protein
MKTIKNHLAKLLGTFFALGLLSIPVFCQSGPPGNFSLTVTNNLSQVFISIVGTSNGSTYAILTNRSLATTGWGVWQGALLASNSITPAPPMNLSSTVLFFRGEFLSAPAPNYATYSNFWLSISNSATNLYITLQGTLPSLTYLILTNSSLSSTNWGIWTNLLATNSLIPAPPFVIGSNALFFEGALVFSTTASSLPDWWCMEYFGTLNVNPYSDADNDGLCNLDEYILGTNPTNAYSITPLHTDAQALLLAYTNFDANCRYQLFVTNGPDTNTMLVTMSPTLVGTNYQIYTHEQSDTNNTWRVETNFFGTNSATTVAITLNGRNLDYIGGYGEDSDGDGLSDGYEVLATWTDPYLPDTGMTGIGDGYKDPDGDGYSNLQEYQNGTNPHVFDAPFGALNPVSNYGSGSNTLTVSWEPASGPVTGYVVYVQDPITYGWDAVATTSATQLTAVIENPESYGYATATYGYFAVAAVYPNGLSLINSGQVPSYPVVAQSAIVHGPGGTSYLMTSAMNTNVIGYVTGYSGTANYPSAFYPEYSAYSQSGGAYPPSDEWYETSIDIPASQFTNGIAILSDSQVIPYVSPGYDILCPQLQGSASTSQWFASSVSEFANVPFIDGTIQMKQNIRFLLRVAGNAPFEYVVNAYDSWMYPENYVYSSYYDIYSPYYPFESYGFSEAIDHFAPFEDNYFFRNFAFDATSVNASGTYDTGFNPFSNEYWPYSTYAGSQQQFVFPTYNYVTLSNQASIPAILSSDTTQWVGYFYGGDNFYISAFGGYYFNGLLAMSNYVNVYGLPYNSLDVVLGNGTQLAAVSPTNSVAGYDFGAVSGNFFAGTAQPVLQTVDYYFAQPGTDPLPGYQDGSFDVTNTTPLIIGSVGTPMTVAGYAKQAVLNGNPNVFAYLGQYFTNAFVMSNGVVTTNPAGILSEYGEFFPTVPGQIALMTKPDPDQTNIQGTCVVDIIRLSLDVNHDGIMDETYTGPDNTGNGVNYVFWVNDDNDGTGIGQDINISATPDRADYTYGQIRSWRNLEDFALLWVSGLPKLPKTNGYTITLTMSASSGSPAINLYASYDTNGGTSYLSDTNAAAAQFTQVYLGTQLEFDYSQQLATINANQSYTLPVYSDGTPEYTHFLFEGAGIGTGQLTLTVSQATSQGSNVLAQSSEYIDLHDIKDLYERTIITNNMNGAISNWTSGIYTTQYPLLSTDNDTNLIVLIHGINVGDWDWVNDSETVFKRLYWAGFRGSFVTVRWPCNYLTPLPSPLSPSAFNSSELQAYKASTALIGYLSQLRTRYPGYQLSLLVHSQGNAVVSEAIKNGASFDNYILTQGALPDSAYDLNAPTNSIMTAFEYLHSTPEWQPMGYHGAYTNVTGHIINFFNPVDAVLAIWIYDQEYLKPTFYVDSSYYYYDGTNSYYDAPLMANRLVTDPEESRAMVSRSRTLSVGQSGPTSGHGVIQSALDLNAQYGFTNSTAEHSAQWTRPIQTSLLYYDGVLSSCNIPTQQPK